jgi:hypothetical protein
MIATEQSYGPYRWIALASWMAAIAYFIGGTWGNLPNAHRVVPVLVVVYLLTATKARRRGWH